LMCLVMATLIVGGLVAPSASAAVCSAAELVPQLRGTTVNQGLGSYPDLVQGKDVLVRYFLSRPEKCTETTQTVRVTSASLAIKVAGVNVGSVPAPTNNLTPPPEISLWTSAPAPNSTGDPLFKVSPSNLNVPAGAASSLTFEATIGWSNSLGNSGTVIYSVSKNMLGRTDSLRVMTVPMGTAANPLGDLSNVNNPRLRAVIDGLAQLGRIDPVANGLGDLSTTPELPPPGVQYYLNKSTYLDINNHLSSGKFCGDKDGTLKSTLAGLLEQHNTANPLSQSVDRVVGLVDQAISCTNRQGEAIVGGRPSWVQVRYDNPATTTTVEPSLTGALMAHELFHNDGGVPCGAYRPDTDPLTPETKCPIDRDSITDAYHSPRSAADGTDPDRAYNLFGFNGTAPAWLLNDRSVARYLDTGWDNNNTLFERDDWRLALCRRGGPMTDDCTLPLERTLAGAESKDVTVLVGYTDGTPNGTSVFDSFAEQPGGANQPPDASPLTLVQRDPTGALLSRTPVEVTDLRDTPGGGPESDGPLLFFGAAYESDPLAARLELHGPGGTVLYSRDEFPAAQGIRNVALEISPRGTPGTGCPPEGCPTPSVIDSEASGFTEAAEKLTFEDLPNGTTVAGAYSEEHGVSFVDDGTTTPRIIGDCVVHGSPCRLPAGTGTQSGGFNVWNQPDTLPVGPVDPVPSSAGVPLTIEFAEPVQKVGMYIGNDDTNTTTATLIALDQEGVPIPGAVATERSFGAAVDEFIGLDAGMNRIASVRLDYGDSILGEEIDDLVYEFGDETVTPVTEWTATASADHDQPGLLRAAFFAKCPDDDSERDFIRVPLVAGVKPSVEGQRASFSHDFDSRVVCARGGRVTILVRINDGYTQSDFVEDSVGAPAQQPPVAVISSPAAQAKAPNILSHEAMSFVGFGWDHEDGSLPDSSLRWFLSGPSFSGADPNEPHGTGSTLTLPAPKTDCGWSEGTHTARLEVTDSKGRSSSETVTFEVSKDCDNDGIPAPVEPCFTGSDANSADAFIDFDKDGLVNQQDENPCSPRTDYEGIANFDPDTLNVPSKGGANSVTVHVTLKHRDLRQVSANPDTLRVVEIGGADVSQDPAFRNTGWSVTTAGGTVIGTAKFDRQALISFLYDKHGITNADVTFLIKGEAPAQPGSPAFRFTALDTFKVQGQR
jgi:hypothetical protein